LVCSSQPSDFRPSDGGDERATTRSSPQWRKRTTLASPISLPRTPSILCYHQALNRLHLRRWRRRWILYPNSGAPSFPPADHQLLRGMRLPPTRSWSPFFPPRSPPSPCHHISLTGQPIRGGSPWSPLLAPPSPPVREALAGGAAGWWDSKP
jgi:hypothetical protein